MEKTQTERKFTFSKYELLTSFILMLVYAVRIFSIDYYVDSEILNKPGYLYNWDKIGRFGLIFLKKITGLDWINPYLEGVLFLLAIGVLVKAVSVFLKKIAPKLTGVEIMIFTLLGLLFPTYGEQFLFRFQSFEIVLSEIFVVGACIDLIDYIREKKLVSLIVSIVLLTVSFGVYQSMANLILLFYGATLLFLLKENDLKLCLRGFWTALIQFCSAFALYEIIANLFFVDGTYISDKIAWKTQGIAASIQNIKDYVKEVLFGMKLFYPLSYTIVLVVFVAAILICAVKVISVKENPRKFAVTKAILYCVSGAIVAGAPFFLAIVQGKMIDFRAQLCLPWSIAFMWLFIAGLKEFINTENLRKKLKFMPEVLGVCFVLWLVVGGFFILLQTSPLERLFYTEAVVAQSDRMIAEDIIYDLRKCDTSKKVVILGSVESNVNASCYTTKDALTYQVISVYQLDFEQSPQYFYSTHRILEYFKTLGFKFIPCTQGDMPKAYEIGKDMPVYPANGSVKETDDMIVVKLNEF